jgi:hypothetical protein
MESNPNPMSSTISLDVNGILFEIEHAQLISIQDSALAAMFSGRWDESNHMKDGRILIEGRDPSIFQYVIQYLTNGHKMPKIEDQNIRAKIKEEFKYWCIPSYDS